ALPRNRLPPHRRPARRPAIGNGPSRRVPLRRGPCRVHPRRARRPFPHRGRLLSGNPSPGRGRTRRPAPLQGQDRRRCQRCDHPVFLQCRRLFPLRGRSPVGWRGRSDRARRDADRELQPAPALLRSLWRRNPALAGQAHGVPWRRCREHPHAGGGLRRRSVPAPDRGRRAGTALLHAQPRAPDRGRARQAVLSPAAALLRGSRPLYPWPMPYLRHPVRAAALLSATAMLAVAAAMPAPVHAQIRQCTTPDGGTVYTDRSCDSLGAIENRPAAEGGAGSGANAAPRYRGGCARRVRDLVFEVTAAIDARDTNRLARSYHWPGTSTRSGYALIERLDAIASRPLLNGPALRPARTVGSASGQSSWGIPATLTAPPPP